MNSWNPTLHTGVQYANVSAFKHKTGVTNENLWAGSFFSPVITPDGIIHGYLWEEPLSPPTVLSALAGNHEGRASSVHVGNLRSKWAEMS